MDGDGCILQQVLEKDVQPALGCTEPGAVALACSHAAKQVGGVRADSSIRVAVSSGVLKNGFGAGIPNTGGQRGLKIAAALGAIVRITEDGLEVLKHVHERDLRLAHSLVESGAVSIGLAEEEGFFIRAEVETANRTGSAVIKGSHTNVIVAGCENLASRDSIADSEESFREELSRLSLAELLELADKATTEQIRYVLQGVQMNLDVAQAGRSYDLVGASLESMHGRCPALGNELGPIGLTVVYAVDARMTGAPMPVMSSGGSGNQGIVAALVPYLVGKEKGYSDRVIGRSIVLSHLINSYIKCQTGHLSYMCGCAVAAAIGAAAGIVYLTSRDHEVIGAAINIVAAEVAGLLCDGAKSTCSLKVLNAAGAAVRGACLAMNGFRLKGEDGIVGSTPEETIRNLGRIGKVGDQPVNETLLAIIAEKAGV